MEVLNSWLCWLRLSCVRASASAVQAPLLKRISCASRQYEKEGRQSNQDAGGELRQAAAAFFIRDCRRQRPRSSRELALYAIENGCEGQAFRVVVLQEGAVPQQVLSLNACTHGFSQASNFVWQNMVRAHAIKHVHTGCSHKKKRMRQIKKMAQRGLLDPEQEDPFSLFVASTDIRYCYYHDTHKILGNTFGMCVLQVCLATHYCHAC